MGGVPPGVVVKATRIGEAPMRGRHRRLVIPQKQDNQFNLFGPFDERRAIP